MNTNHANTAGEFLRKLRLGQFKIQGEVAKACGKTVSYWSALENGKKHVTPAIVEFVVKYFELDEKECEELKELTAKQGTKEHRLDLTNVDEDAKELAVAFAMHLKNFDTHQIEAIQNIINHSKEGL
jgi:transcriptional regulator with XRE-family HTH domain